MTEGTRLRERLEICTDNEDDWKEFLKSCTNAFQDATPFKRSHPDPQKRRQFVKAYFDYLYETEMSGGRAGLVCLKQPNENGEDEIVYGVSGIFQNSERRAAVTSHMMQIDEAGARLALREDEWVRNNICCKIDNLSKSLGFSWVFFNLQASKYPKHGFAHKYFQRLGGMFLYDGIKRGKFSSNTTGIAYTVIDEPKLREFYVHVGMVEIAHLHCNLDDKPRCSEHIGSKEACDCVYVMYIGYPEKELLKDYLKNLFQKKNT